MEFSAQTGYVPSKSMLPLKKLKLIRKLKMLIVGHTNNETLNTINLVFMREILRHKGYHQSSLPSQSLG